MRLLHCSYFLILSGMTDFLLALLTESKLIRKIFSNNVVVLVNNPKSKQFLAILIFKTIKKDYHQSLKLYLYKSLIVNILTIIIFSSIN